MFRSRKGPLRGQPVLDLTALPAAAGSQLALTAGAGPSIEDMLDRLGLIDPNQYELALIAMWVGAFARSSRWPSPLESNWWGIKAAGTFSIGPVAETYWPRLPREDRIRFQPRRTRLGIYARLPKNSPDGGEFRVGAGHPESHHPPRPLIYRPRGLALIPQSRNWVPLGHFYRTDDTDGFFDRLLHRALGAKYIRPKSAGVDAPAGHHSIVRGCPRCAQRDNQTLGAAGCAYPSSWITAM